MAERQPDGGDLQMTEEDADDVTIVSVAGRLDTLSSARLSRRLGELLHAGRTNLLIETSRLTYISSAGIRALLVAARAAAANGGRLAVCSMTTPISRVTELAGLSAEFETYPSREEALAVIAGSGRSDQ